MARLVAGDGNACDRATRTVSVREIQVVILRVVVVGELAGNALDAHGVATVGIEHAASDRSARVAVRTHLGPRLVRRVDIALRGKTEHRTNKNNQQVQRVDTKAVSIVIRHANSSESNYTLEAFYPLAQLTRQHRCVGIAVLERLQRLAKPRNYKSSILPSFTVSPILPESKSSRREPTSSKRQPSRKGLCSGCSM